MEIEYIYYTFLLLSFVFYLLARHPALLFTPLPHYPIATNISPRLLLTQTATFPYSNPQFHLLKMPESSLKQYVNKYGKIIVK